MRAVDLFCGCGGMSLGFQNTGIEVLAAYDNWTKAHAEQYEALKKFQANRVFRMPAGQYYQAIAGASSR